MFEHPLRPAAWAAMLAAALFCPSTFAEPPQLCISRNEDGVTVREGTLPVLSYQAKPRSLAGKWERANYVHPLHDLRGEVISEDFPKDHPHHRGVFWAWHQVWVGDRQLGDSWACQDFQWEVRSIETSTSQSGASIFAHTLWKSSRFVDQQQTPIPVVEERCEINILPRQPGYRLIDFQIALRALVEGVRIGGSDDEKGYGGFSPRIRLTGSERFLGDTGPVEPTTTALEAGTWMNITGPESGIAILVHPDNPGVQAGRTRWILRRQGSMQNAVFPGRETVPLSTTRATVLRYRLLIHDGQPSAESIAKLAEVSWDSAD